MFDRAAYMKEYRKNYYIKNRDYIRKQQKEHYLKSHKHYLEYKKKWYERNKDNVKSKAKQWYQNYLLRRQKYNLKTLYGISLDQYNQLIEKQNNLCAICKKQDRKKLSVDHNHITGKVRGLLCSKCNFGIGIFKDDLNLLETAIKYLKESYETN